METEVGIALEDGVYYSDGLNELLIVYEVVMFIPFLKQTRVAKIAESFTNLRCKDDQWISWNFEKIGEL